MSRKGLLELVSFTRQFGGFNGRLQMLIWLFLRGKLSV